MELADSDPTVVVSCGKGNRVQVGMLATGEGGGGRGGRDKSDDCGKLYTYQQQELMPTLTMEPLSGITDTNLPVQPLRDIMLIVKNKLNTSDTFNNLYLL